MAKRLTTEDHFALLRTLRSAPPSDGATQQLADLLASSRLHGMVLKGAADLADQHGARSLAPALAKAAQTLAPPEGIKRDPGCEGKLAALRTLLDWEADLPDLYLHAAKWVQVEPIYPKPRDTAGECRGMAAIGIAQTRPPEAVSLLVDLLADADPNTRANAAIAWRLWRGPEALPVLRLKALTGDDSADVMGEVFASMLHHDARGQLPFVAAFLEKSDTAIIEAAAVALGQSHREEALASLTETYNRYQKHTIHTSLLMAIALLRTDASFDFLLNLLGKASAKLGEDVLDALRIYKGDKRAMERIHPLAKRHEETARVYQELFE
jgi:HEAT repeat protein